MKRLIVNADDFGMSASVNHGIIQGHQLGIVTSTTMLANGDQFEQAVALAHANPGLQIGVHLNAIEGEPVLGPHEVPSLLDSENRFLGSSWRLGLRQILNRVSGMELRAEFRAQIAKVVESGITPTHIDSHQHIHCIPAVFEAALDAAQHFGITRVRVPTEARFPGLRSRQLSRRNRLKSGVISRLAQASSRRIANATTTDYFVGPRFMGRLDTNNLVDLIDGLPPGTTELMCHPASRGDGSRILRDEELGALVSDQVRQAIEASSVELVGFAAIGRCR